MADEKTEVVALVQAYAAALTSGSLDAWTATLGDDVVFQPPDQPQVSGRTEVVAWARQSFFDPFKMRLDVSFDEIEVLETFAFVRGRFTLALTPREVGSTVENTGKFMNTFRREPSGSWKYSCVGFNFDAPMAAPASR
jgi:ketosteroid isomerase-like protein